MLMDVENITNFTIARDFCLEQDLPFYPSPGMALSGCPDAGVKNVYTHLAHNQYDFIECVSWANAATNLNVIASKRGNSKLIFTPHSQPLWSLPNHDRYFMTSLGFKRTLNASDYIFLDSQSELNLIKDIDSKKIHCIPLGVDTDKYTVSAQIISNQIICICDCQEPRKRIDLLLSVFSNAYSQNNKIKLVLAGKGSDRVVIPDKISKAVKRLGYINNDTLVRLHKTASLFVLLSDYEAFGLPIAEALCSGCPVLLNRQDVLVDVFSDLPGVFFTDNLNIQETSHKLLKLVATSFDRANIAAEAKKKFSFSKTYGLKKSILLDKNQN